MSQIMVRAPIERQIPINRSRPKNWRKKRGKNIPKAGLKIGIGMVRAPIR
jgi:hypothetical protein